MNRLVAVAEPALRRRVRGWYRYGRASERMPLLAAAVVRLVAAGWLVLALVWVASRYRHPVVAVAIGAVLLAETGIVLWLWQRFGAVGRAWLLLDIPVNAAAIVLDGWQVPDASITTWAFAVFPYTVILSVTLGVGCRRFLGALAIGVPWATAYLIVMLVLHHVSAGQALPALITYLTNPVLGWSCALVIRRTAAELDAAQRSAVEREIELVTVRERARHSRVLHDRVLQTLETLSRPGWVTDAELHERIAADAAWLRAFVETGRVDQTDDLVTGLEAVTRATRRTGLGVELTVAGVRGVPAFAGVDLPEPSREALIDATHEVLAALAHTASSVVVHAQPEDRWMLVTILATSRAGQPHPDAVERARERIAAVGGGLVQEPVPYVELRVPSPP